MTAETVNLNPNINPQFSREITLDVSSKAVQKFAETFGNMVDAKGKIHRIISTEGSYDGLSYSRVDKDGNLFEVIRNLDNGELKVFTTSQTKEGEKTEIYRLNGDTLTYEDPSKNMVLPGTYELTGEEPRYNGRIEVFADRVPPSQEIQEAMLGQFVSSTTRFEESQRRPLNRLRRSAGFILKINSGDKIPSYESDNNTSTIASNKPNNALKDKIFSTMPSSETIEKITSARSNPSTFGGEVIVGTEEQLLRAVSNGEKYTDSEQQIENISDVRDFLASFDSSQHGRAIIDNLFNQISLPMILKNSKRLDELKSGKKITWTEWLSSDATNDQLINFLQYYDHHHKEYGHSSEFNKKNKKMISDMQQATQKLVEAGFLHRDLQEDASEILGELSIVLGDAFEMAQFAEEGDIDFESRVITLSETANKPQYFHELGHSLLDGLRVLKYGDEDIEATWLNEAVVEHITRTIIDGDSTTVSPNDRNEKDDRLDYRLERELLASIIKNAKGEVTIKDFAQASSAQSKEARLKAYENLENGLKKAYGNSNFLIMVTRYLDSQSITQHEGWSDQDDEKYEAALRDLIDNPRIAVISN